MTKSERFAQLFDKLSEKLGIQSTIILPEFRSNFFPKISIQSTNVYLPIWANLCLMQTID